MTVEEYYTRYIDAGSDKHQLDNLVGLIKGKVENLES